MLLLKPHYLSESLFPIKYRKSLLLIIKLSFHISNNIPHQTLYYVCFSKDNYKSFLNMYLELSIL